MDFYFRLWCLWNALYRFGLVFLVFPSSFCTQAFKNSFSTDKYFTIFSQESHGISLQNMMYLHKCVVWMLSGFSCTYTFKVSAHKLLKTHQGGPRDKYFTDISLKFCEFSKHNMMYLKWMVWVFVWFSL